MEWTTIAGILGGIVLIGNAGVTIYKWLTPALKLQNAVEENTKNIEQLKEAKKSDFEYLVKLKELDKLQCECMLSMMNHMIDGNHIDNMKVTRDKIQDLLVKY